MNDDRTIRDRLADSQTQEKVREAIEKLRGVCEYEANLGVGMFAVADLRTLLAAYTRMEADMAEARRLMEPFEEISTRYPREPDHANVEMFVGLAPFRALAAFYNKGEE